MSLESRARDFATRAHKGQVRKYTAALLHDTVEDTDVTLDEVRAKFGDKVAELVEMLTDVSKPKDGDRNTRKAQDREHSAKASADAQTVKLADLLDNSRSIMKHDPEFGKVYMQEKVELLKVLTKGDHKLLSQCRQVVRAAGFEVG